MTLQVSIVTLVGMKSNETLIADDVLRLTLSPTPHFEYSHFLITDEKSCLVHSGKLKMFEYLKTMVQKRLKARSLDYIVFSHVEADETGSLNNWLKEYPRATVVCNKVANINLEDFLLRPARILNEGETLDLGRRHLRLINTPHFPHGWDAHMWYETTQDVLFSSDLYCHGGESLPIVEHDISQPIIDFYSKGAFIPYGRSTNEAMTKLAEFNPRTLAPMHGSVIKGEVCKVIFEKVRADLQARI